MEMDLSMSLKTFSWLRDEFIYGAHLTALMSPALVLSVLILLDLPVNGIFLVIAYILTQIVYSYNFQKEIDNDSIINVRKAIYLKKRAKYFNILIILYTIILIILTILIFNYGFAMFVLILLVGGILYTLIFKVLTKTIPGFKSVYTTILWTYAAIFFVILYYSYNVITPLVILTSFIFLQMFINVNFFDIRDIVSDKVNKLKTIPVILGKDKSIFVLNILNIISLIIIIYGIFINAIPGYSLALIAFFIYTLFYLNYRKHDNYNNEFLFIMADAGFVLWPIILIVAKILFY
jgi:4-hydroxybenzoate polyprenyltransferase